jgi:short-subunit dehydrogenase
MKGRVYLSGATGGFGRILAVECARRGWDLFLTDINGGKLETLAGALSYTYGVKAGYEVCNMADFNARTALAGHLNASGMRFSMLINVAGIDPEGPFMECPRETIDRVMNINLVSPLDMIRSLVPLRYEGEPMHILNVCSMGGFFPMPIKAVYAASKRALIDMTHALAAELKPLGITVTGVCPAGMATNEVLLKNMDTQGIMSNLTTLELGYIASSTIDRALKGKVIYIPGFFNRFIVGISRLVPVRVVCRFIFSRWQKTYKAFREALDAAGLVRRLPADDRKPFN